MNTEANVFLNALAVLVLSVVCCWQSFKILAIERRLAALESKEPKP